MRRLQSSTGRKPRAPQQTPRGIALGEHTKRSLILKLALTEGRRHDIAPCHTEGQSLREIAYGVGVSIAVVAGAMLSRLGA
ncbi:hypothetical protein ACIBG0_36970 [Nocardia sp. NPDC050630]|uniref:hypothetical protein n=1 Tax=Nocardia sp. NPDC050630 TaxID=3364321 RepID=UPI003797D859